MTLDTIVAKWLAVSTGAGSLIGVKFRFVFGEEQEIVGTITAVSNNKNDDVVLEISNKTFCGREAVSIVPKGGNRATLQLDRDLSSVSFFHGNLTIYLQ